MGQKKQTKNILLILGLQVLRTNISFTSEKTYKFIEQHLGKELTKTAVDGKGLLAYSGKSSEDGSIFLGKSDKLESYTLRLRGEDGLKVFIKFRNEVLTNEQHREMVQDMKLNLIDCCYTLNPQNNMNSPKDFTDCLNGLVQAQTKTAPRLAIEQGRLIIGGKSGSNLVIVSAELSGAREISNIVISYKVKESVAAAIWDNLVGVPEATVETCIILKLVDTISRLSSTTFLEHCRNDMVRSYPVGKLSYSSSTNKKANTKVSSFVLRSLAGILNKLKTQAVSQEVQSIFKTWLQNLVEQQNSFTNGSSFIEEIKTVLSSTKASASPPPQGRSRRQRAPVVNPADAAGEGSG